MKKHMLILMIVFFSLGLFGCQNGEDSFFADVTRFWKDVDRAGTTNSRQYVYSQTEMLYQLYEEYIDPSMTDAQKKYLVTRMRRVANEIPESEVPVEVINILRRK